MSSNKNNSNEEEEEAPFHVLMALQRPLDELLVKHDSLVNDFLSKRFHTLYPNETPQTMWSASLLYEQAMMECCEIEKQEDEMIGGSLQKGKEGDFCRILALHCHTAASRALALAILEKTIQQDELENPHDENDVDDTMMMDTVVSSGDVLVKSEDTVDTKPLSQPQQQEEAKPAKEETSSRDDIGGRMARFLQAGGLGILKQWLMDAMTPIQMLVTTPSPQQPQQQKPTRIKQTFASPTGPLLLPLLQILTDMPFDKQLVMSVKINKQIRKLKKQLDEVVASRQRLRKDDKQWTDPVAGGLIVNEVANAVSTLMSTWEEHSKTSCTTGTVEDAFASLQAKMKERLELLKQFELGETEKPRFLLDFEEAERKAKEAKEVSKLTTEQRAARERKQEREEMLKLHQKQHDQAKQKLLQLKQQSRAQKRQAASPVTTNPKKTKTGRKVHWKDGFDNADNVRRRNLLEQVHVYTKESDYDDEYDQAVQQEEESEGIVASSDDDVVVVKQQEGDGDGMPLANNNAM